MGEKVSPNKHFRNTDKSQLSMKNMGEAFSFKMIFQVSTAEDYLESFRDLSVDNKTEKTSINSYKEGLWKLTKHLSL